MDEEPQRTQLDDSSKVVDTTTATRSYALNNHNITNLFKEDSDSSSHHSVLPPRNFYEREEIEHEELRKFMKKADKLNSHNYQKLHFQKGLVPQGSTINLYKSSKNILEEIGIPTIQQRRDQQIKQIYLGAKNTKRHSSTKKKLTKTIYQPHKRKLSTISKQVQTDKTQQPQNNSLPKQRYSNKKKVNRSLKAIEEDEDEDLIIPTKRRAKKHYLNTISIGNSKDMQEFTKVRINADHYLQNVSKTQNSFTSSLKKYDFKEESNFKTVFKMENDIPKGQPTIKALVNNPWDEEAINHKTQTSKVIEKEQVNNKGKKMNSIKLETIDEKKQNSNQSRKATSIQTPQLVKGQDAMPSIPTIKKNNEKNAINEAATENSLFVEQNNSEKQTTPSEYSFTINKGYTSTNFYEQDEKSRRESNNVGKKQNQAQIPEIREIAIGTDTSNFVMAKKSIHPIKIDFNQSDSAWITAHFKPKSQFIKQMDTQNFHIKKYRNGVYFGQITEDSLKHGKGVVFYFNGRCYQGSFINDVKEGKGFQYLPDGSVYKGEFKNGLKEGKGLFEWPNGQIYDGQWVKGKKSGSGMWKSSKGDSYIGEWKNGKVEGFGVYVAKEGDRYEGQFKNSMKSGYGTERYANGDTFTGEFLKNRPNGQGEFYYHNGDYFKGIFSNGLKHGDGYLKSAQGQIFQGEFRNDKKCGYGELNEKDGIVYKGNFQNDLKHGYGEMNEGKGFPVTGFWINGNQVKEDMGVIAEDQLERQQSLPAKKKGKVKKNHMPEFQKAKVVSNKKSPRHSPKRSIQKSISPDEAQVKRACGCRRKH